MKNQEESHLIFTEIINGYSPINTDSFGELFIKHFSHFEALKTEKQYLYSLEEAKSKNLPTYIQRKKTLSIEGVWTKSDEDSIEETVGFITGLRERISKEFLLSKRKLLRREVVLAEKRLDAMFMKRDFLVGLTAEKYANRQSVFHQITNSFYSDEALKKPLEDLNDEETYEKLSAVYSVYKKRINLETIKNIAISSFFYSLFHMCGDNAYYFYGKPIIQLTTHQTELFNYGKYFKKIMSDYGEKIPKEMIDSPDDMIEFFEITKNVEASGILKDGEGEMGATSIVGATRDDMKMMGIDPSMIRNLGADIAKSGKTMLNKEDLMKLRGA